MRDASGTQTYQRCLVREQRAGAVGGLGATKRMLRLARWYFRFDGLGCVLWRRVPLGLRVWVWGDCVSGGGGDAV